jgi:hypothetical protein
MTYVPLIFIKTKDIIQADINNIDENTGVYRLSCVFFGLFNNFLEVLFFYN